MLRLFLLGYSLVLIGALIGCAPGSGSRTPVPVPPPAISKPHTLPNLSNHAPRPSSPSAEVKPINKIKKKSTSSPAVLVRPSRSIIPLAPLAYHHRTQSGVSLSMVSFDNRIHQLRVADQQNGPGTRWTDARSAASTYNGLAAINAGFFTPEGKPLGLLVETGSKRGSLNKSSLGAGMFISTRTGATIIRRERYASSSLAANAYNLLQTGPMLVERGKPVTGLSKTSSRPRSFLAWDGHNHWAIGYADVATLDGLAKALAGTSPAGFKIKTAINLDGGRSSDLWAGPDVRNGNKTHRGFLNKPVRNYLVLIPR